jgi:CRISPR-associated protein Cmr6
MYERYAPLGFEGEELGKIPKEYRVDFLEHVAKIPVPDFYRGVVGRWTQALRGHAVTAVVQATSRILLGHGNSAPSEVGISLHHVYGVPYIPGPGLKGLANHYLASWGAASDERWHGVRYDEHGRPSGPPGKWHNQVFGCPNLSDSDGTEQYGAAGRVTFEDALLLPEHDRSSPLVLDVVTPHQSSYYRDFGAADPNDWTDPIPVTFLSVRPGTRFLVAVSYAGSDDRLAKVALSHLVDALGDWGVGAKTRAGYGRLERVTAETEVGARAGVGQARVPQAVAEALTMTPALMALDAAVAAVVEPEDLDTAPPITQRLDAFLVDSLFDGLTPDEIEAAQVIVRRLMAHRGLKKKRSTRLDEIRAKVGA